MESEEGRATNFARFEGKRTYCLTQNLYTYIYINVYLHAIQVLFTKYVIFPTSTKANARGNHDVVAVIVVASASVGVATIAVVTAFAHPCVVWLALPHLLLVAACRYCWSPGA